MKIVPAVEETRVVSDIVNIVSLTSTAAPPSVSGTLNTGCGVFRLRTMYRESSLRLSSTSSPAGSSVMESGSPTISVVSALFVTTFHTDCGAPGSADWRRVLVASSGPAIRTIAGVDALTCDEVRMHKYAGEQE